MRNKRIFDKFASGYTVAINPSYDNRMIGILMSAWDDRNPVPQEPQPLEVTEKVKGGTRKRKLLNDPEYLEKLTIWRNEVAERDARRATAQTDLVLKEAIDPESIDMALVERARNALEARYGTRGEDNDVMFFLNIIGDSGHGKPGESDYRPNELFELLRFISQEQGPPGALVEHLLKTTFQNDDTEQADGAVSGYLGIPTATGSETGIDSAGTLNTDSGG